GRCHHPRVNGHGYGQWAGAFGGSRAAYAPRPLSSGRAGADRNPRWLRHEPVRGVRCHHRWRDDEVVHEVRGPGRRRHHSNDRGRCGKRGLSSGSGRILGNAWSPVRLLHPWNDHVHDRLARTQPEPVRRRDSPRARRQLLPLHWISEHCAIGSVRGGQDERWRADL
ncbi:MAG: Aerobic carbon monoxide dehydrogenase (quinone), small chain, partial [uncultured Thermomicrobiales bacterium]